MEMLGHPPGMYDTPNREYQGSQQGRWLSPDPAGTGWNQYAYGTNRNSEIDPSGLECIMDSDDPGTTGSGGGVFFPGTPGFIPSSYYGIPGGGFNFGLDFDGFGGDSGDCGGLVRVPFPLND
jgi:uncharacterized protein RhaS with RHS repeats